ncbi:baseplate assembly protein [Vibrio cholerae]
MFIPGQNQLAKPEVVAVPPFEQQLARFKQAVIDHVAKSDAAMAAKVEETLQNEAELATKMVEACTVVLQTRIREVNEDALQMFAYWAEDSNLDAVVSNLGLRRQVLDEGDANAFPPVPATLESNEHLRLRYFLAPYSFSNAGPRLAYKYHAMTLDERPTVSVDAPEPNKVVVTYEFGEGSMAGQVKDATGLRTAPGEVKVTVLAREGNGTPSDELIAAVTSYFQRDDVAPETDEITVAKATILPYQIRAIAYISKGPDTQVTKSAAEALLQQYADEQHHLGATIEPSMVYHVLHQAGAKKVDLLEPLAELAAGLDEAPWCQLIDIEIRTL